MTRKITISLSDHVFNKIEELRGTETRFRSGYIDGVLRKELGLKTQEPMTIPK